MWREFLGSLEEDLPQQPVRTMKMLFEQDAIDINL